MQLGKKNKYEKTDKMQLQDLYGKIRGRKHIWKRTDASHYLATQKRYMRNFGTKNKTDH